MNTWRSLPSRWLKPIETYFEENDLGSGYVLEPRVFRPQRGISEDACEDPDLG